MAAEKLTKGRFAQIIIMLTLLIVVFFWRTFTYEAKTVVNCNAAEVCNFEVNESVFSAQVSDGNIEIKTENKRWDLTSDGLQSKQPQHWQLPYKNIVNVEFVNRQSKQSYNVELVFN